MAAPNHSSRKRLFALVALLPVWLALAAASSSSTFQLPFSQSPSVSDRKSLGWGPEHLHKHFVSTDTFSRSSLTSRDLNSDPKQAHAAAIHFINADQGSKAPHDVALRLAKHLLDFHNDGPPKGVDFYVRPDSYTDTSSGISHFYVRQLVNGLEVVDADLNINTSPDGRILSFGSSLYKGQVPAPFTNPAATNYAAAKAQTSHQVNARCQELRTQLGQLLFPEQQVPAQLESNQDWQEFVRGGVHQMVFQSSDAASAKRVQSPRRAAAASQDVLPLQEELHELCSVPSDDPLLQGAGLGSRLAGSLAQHSERLGSLDGPDAILDPRLALVYFLQQATPDEALAAKLSDPKLAEIEANQIFTTFEHKVQPHGGKTASGTQPSHTQIEYLHNVPTAKGPVPAQLAYIQTETGELNLVWKFQVPLKDNAYEAYVDATRPGSIGTVVDWVHSMPRKIKATTATKVPELGRPNFEGYAKGGKKQKPQPPSDPSRGPVYKVFKWGLNDPTEGKRTYEKGIHYDEASPVGWHTVPGKRSPFDTSNDDGDARVVKLNSTFYKDTRGNNVFAQADLSGNGDWRNGQVHRPKGKTGDGTDMMFNYPYPWRKAEKKHEELSTELYTAAATVQLFVTINEFHDLLYSYGFDEPSGNFQEHNFGRGGEEKDGVIAFAQDGAGTDNADFMTPPDGQRGRMRMYIWDQSTPFRDGDFEAGIVIHEYSHGLSTRLTGGPANSGCLGWGEAGGMGEGWGDVLASIIRRTGSQPHDWPMGSWASNRAKGIRNYPYSTNQTINPETYQYLDRSGYWGVHAIGEVWATMLNEVEEALVVKHGFTVDLFPPATTARDQEQKSFFLTDAELADAGVTNRASQRRVPRHGNSLLVQLILDGMKLQPCRPSFFDARDAIIQADKHLTGGQNRCLLWKAFAKRGLGPDAAVVGRTPWGGGKRTDGFSVPKECDV